MQKRKLRVIYKNIGKTATSELKEESIKRVNDAFDFIFEEIEKDMSRENHLVTK